MNGLAESIDHMLAVEFRRSAATVSSGVIDPLYRSARDQASEPLAWAAAKALLSAGSDEGTIYIATGHVHPVALPAGETDGPLGAVALAKALVGLASARVVLLCEDVVVPVLRAVCIAAGLNVREPEDLPLPRSVAVLPFPTDPVEGRAVAERLVADATAVVAIEKIGPCEGGGYRTGSGSRVDDSLAKVDYLVDLARDAGILTIGIGDLGNEMGMANIAPAVRETVRTGTVIASTVATDLLIVAGCSNWGAYGVVAGMAALTSDPNVLHTGEHERYMLEAASNLGCVDGFSTGPTREVDGASLATHIAWVDLLRDIVTIALDKRIPERHAIERALGGLEES